jgi:tetratricopeptide (TPR) repeat protein
MRSRSRIQRLKGAPSPSPSVDVVPGDVTQEEIDAVDAEARWLLNPLSMLDLSDTKDQLLKMMAAGVDYQKRGQFANARATYTRAIAMEAPNQRMLAALYYNRSACQRELGQLGLSLRDAQKAAELDPTMVKAHWRVADVALILKDHEAANEAIVAGLAQSPRCQPLLMLKLQLKL